MSSIPHSSTVNSDFSQNELSTETYQNESLDSEDSSEDSNVPASSTRLERSIEKLCESIIAKRNSQRVKIKRNYALTLEALMDLWLKNLRRELKNDKLLDTVDDSVEKPSDLTAEVDQKKLEVARDIIISHLDESYHRRVIDIQQPADVLKRLREIRKAESHIAHATARQKLFDLRMRLKESVNEFITRFKKVISEYENCLDGIKLTEVERTNTLLRAVSGFFLKVSQAHNAFSVTSRKELSNNEIINLLLKTKSSKNDVFGPQVYVA